MKSFRKELWFNIKTRRGYVNITPEVETALAESGIRDGLCLVNAMHISASVFINDDERGLHADFERWLENLAPHAPTDQYRHNDTGEDNADASYDFANRTARLASHAVRATNLGNVDQARSIAACRSTTPKRLAHRLRGDLDTILDKTLAQDPLERPDQSVLSIVVDVAEVLVLQTL